MEFGYAALRRLVDDWVHGSVLRDPFAAARHRLFIAGALAEGLIALAAFPAFVAWRGAPDWAASGAFALLAAPLLLAILVSRTGRIELGQILRSLSAAALILWLGASGFGAAPVLFAGLALMPVEAALCGSRRVTAGAAVLALTVAAVLPVIGADAPPGGDHALLAFAAILYAGGVALKADALGRDGERATASLADGFRLLSDHATEMITRHGSDGGVRFASAAARRLCGAKPSELCGRGLFTRVHVADRPAFLTAIADAMDGLPTTLRFRLERRDDDGAPHFLAAEMRCSPSRDPSTGERAVVAVTRDVSDEAAGAAEISTASVEVAALIDESLSVVAGKAREKNVAIVRNIAASLPEIDADPRACRQMLINLLSSAVKFSHPGGRVVAGARVAAGMLELSVEDGGIGIGAVDLPKLGQPFFQADSAYDHRFEGTGAGLSVVTRLAELYGGSLRVESEQGKGTMATVSLPIGRSQDKVKPFAFPAPGLAGGERRRA